MFCADGKFRSLPKTSIALSAAAKEVIYYGDEKRVCDCCEVTTLAGGPGPKIGVSKAWLVSQSKVSSSSSLSEAEKKIKLERSFQKPIKYMNLKRNEVASNLRNIATSTIDQNQIDIDINFYLICSLIFY